jgi:hypothetical protein
VRVSGSFIRLQSIQADLDRIVTEGPQAFDFRDTITVLEGAARSSSIFMNLGCPDFTPRTLSE